MNGVTCLFGADPPVVFYLLCFSASLRTSSLLLPIAYLPSVLLYDNKSRWVNAVCSTHSTRELCSSLLPLTITERQNKTKRHPICKRLESLFGCHKTSPFVGPAAGPPYPPARSSHCHQCRHCWNDRPDSVHLFHGSPGLLLLRKKQMDP